MVIFTALPTGTSSDEGRILVDESDYQGVDDEQLPFEIKDIVRIRANEKFSKYYDCMDEIGEGKFGKVYRCREKATGLVLAAKRIKIKRDADREKVEREVAIMTTLRHPRIAQIYDAFATPDNDVVLIMEIVIGGELFDRVVDENYILTELAVVMIVCQLCEAVSYIHSKNIVHLDIKPENIMCVSQTGNRIKLIDFGLAQFYDGSSNLLFMAGTPEFVAPEVIKFEPIDFYTDMWSIGVITYILLSGISPFLGETLGDTYVAVEKGEWEFDDEAFEGISDAAKDFISKLLIMDQKQRMLPEDCLSHPWIVGSRTKAANDLILNQPNNGTPLSKEGLKSYLKNKRFRKATWALVFLIRFKRQTLMSFGRRKVPAAISEIYDSLPASIGNIMGSCAESKASASVIAEPAKDDVKTKKALNEISAAVKETFDTSRAEPVIATKHPEEKKLSSEIPKKKPKPSAIDEGRKKPKPTDEGKTKKGAKKHKEKNNEKSDEISCKPKKVSKHLKTASDGLGRQMKKSAETVSGYGEVSDSKKFIPVMCEVCITLETTKPTASFVEFSKPIFAAESAYLRPLISESVQTNKNEATTEEGPKKYCVSSSDNRTAQESTRHINSVNKLSEINKKGSSVAAILSLFSEKAEQERRHFERRPSRPVRTFRDVEKSSSRKSSLVVTHENDSSCVKLYRAPEEEKKRMKNLIELHRRGSADRKQVDTNEIAAVKQEEGSKSFPNQRVNIVEQDKVEIEGMSLTGTKKMEINPALNAKKGTDWSRKKITVSSLVPLELRPIKKIDQTTAERNTHAIPVAKTSHVRSETKNQKKDTMGFTRNQEMVEGVEKPAGSVMLVKAVQIHALLTSQKTPIQCDSSIISRKTKSWMKLNELQNDSSLNSLSATVKQPNNTKSNSDKKNEAVNEKRALFPELRLSEERCAAKKEVTGNANNQNVPKRKKNKAEIVDRNPNIKDAAQNLVQLGDSREFIEHHDLSGKKKMKKSVEKLKKGLTELIATPGSSHLPYKAKQMKSVEENKSEIQKPISVLQSLSVDLTTTTKHTEEIHADELLQCITSKKPSKAAGISDQKKTLGESKIKKPQDKNGSEIEITSSALNNGETIASEQNKLSNSIDGAMHLIQDTVSCIQESVKVFPSYKTLMYDAVKRKVSRKNSCSRNLLVRMKSEINLAEDKEKRSIRTCQKAVDDHAVLSDQRDKSQCSISIVDLKDQENFSFGWLKLQLETRVNKEKNDQMGCRYRRDLEISPVQSGNAKKALNIWKTMEQSSITKI
ncbi:CAMK/MLCK protein kinase [Loa loa]|uniref:CAMK/MLCK protein kinase n=1 Tax=Loa loa TaxID=7209 RepID=A0A1S0U432_LOALO|nr:CAMK/MLCK protein kinase [Loa loa]EFO24899.2 CAMK/MLCK protein kinase [Loa loa]